MPKWIQVEYRCEACEGTHLADLDHAGFWAGRCQTTGKPVRILIDRVIWRDMLDEQESKRVH